MGPHERAHVGEIWYGVRVGGSGNNAFSVSPGCRGSPSIVRPSQVVPTDSCQQAITEVLVCG